MAHTSCCLANSCLDFLGGGGGSDQSLSLGFSIEDLALLARAFYRGGRLISLSESSVQRRMLEIERLLAPFDFTA